MSNCGRLAMRGFLPACHNSTFNAFWEVCEFRSTTELNSDGLQDCMQT